MQGYAISPHDLEKTSKVTSIIGISIFKLSKMDAMVVLLRYSQITTIFPIKISLPDPTGKIVDEITFKSFSEFPEKTLKSKKSNKQISYYFVKYNL